MSKQIGVIIAVVLVLAVLGIVAFSQMKKPADVTSQPTPQEAKVETSEITKGSIKGLIAAGKSVNCEMSYPDSNIKGQTFVSGNKVRGDFEVSDQNGSMMKTHMISDGTYSYMWTDSSKTGTKFKMDAVKPSNAPSINPQNQAADLDKEVDLKCNTWSTDNSKFTVPSDIQFSDLSNMMKTGGTSAPKLDSSVCNQIEDPSAKASCLKALNGN